MSIPSQGFGGGAPNKFEASGKGRGASMRATRAVGTAKNFPYIKRERSPKREKDWSAGNLVSITNCSPVL